MKKRQRREQPHTPAPRPEPEESYSLEDILDEFGGWSRPAPPAAETKPIPTLGPKPAPAPEPVSAPAAPRRRAGRTSPQPPERFSSLTAPAREPTPSPEPAPAPEPAPEPEPPVRRAPRFQVIQVGPDGKRVSLDPQLPPEPPAAEPARPRSAKTPPNAEAMQKPAAPEETRRLSVKDAHRAVCKKAKGLRLRTRLCFLWAALAVALTVLCHWEVSLGSFVFPRQPTARLLIGLLLAGAITAWDVMVSGVYHALQLRPSLDTLLTVCAVVFTIDGVARAGDGARLPYTAVLLLALLFAMWGRSLANHARRRTLKLVMGLPEKPAAAVISRRAWGSRDCAFRSTGDREAYVDDLEEPSLVDRAMGVYTPLLLAISLLLSVLTAILRGRDFLMCWSGILAASVPLAAFITWWKPFCSLSSHLAQSGAALCGWRGARELRDPFCLAITDSDLFPKGSVTLNGIKIFGSRSVNQIAGYAYAVVARSESGLEPVFHEMFVNQNGVSCKLDAFRRYEGGGIGGSIQGETILMGSLAFMKLMGVRADESQRSDVKLAVYCAVNNELAAIFALKYTHAQKVYTGLQTARRGKRLALLLATRDFMLTPDMVHRKYRVPSESLEYPSVEERARLSGPYAAHGGVPAALLARDGFLPLSEAVSSGQALCDSVRAGLVVNLLGGCIGFLVSALLAWSGSFPLVSAANLMLYNLLWTLPALVLSATWGK